jgi:small conductance mechanosensitive channel
VYLPSQQGRTAMDATTLQKFEAIVVVYATEFGVKILAALAFWVIGRWLIHFVVRMVQGSLSRQKVDPTLLRYVGSIVTVMLNIVLVIGILGYFGVQTTTFAALIAAAGIAIGMAWSGLMSNFAAGAFLVVLRPFKAGDFVTVSGITGTVREIGLFATTLDTPDNVLTVVGNSKIFSDTIQNFSANPYRRVELKAQLAGSTDPAAAAALLKERMAALPNVLAEPAPDVEILEFNLVGPVLAVRPYCHTDHYWQVYFDTNRVIRESFGKAGFSAPMPSQLVVVQNGQTA